MEPNAVYRTGWQPAPAAGRPFPPPPPQTAPGPLRRDRLGRALLVVGALGAGAVGGTVAGAVQDRGRDEPGAVAESAVAPAVGETSLAADTPVAAAVPLDVSQLVADSTPMVVRIDVDTSRGRGTGTGFIVDADGTVVTNAHVVGDATTVEVRLSDGSVETGRVVGRVVSEDLAVVDLDRSGLPFLELGSSDDLAVGERVVAIGNTLGLDGGLTATDGIVSALDRSITVPEAGRLDGLIQTDAAINPGNSGGPLLDLDGRVVGINSAGSPYAQNIGFAIAIDDARDVIGNLRDGVAVTRPFLGVATVALTDDVAAQLGVEARDGVVVTEVVEGSAADAAGVVAGDVIVAVDGEPVTDGSELVDQVRNGQPGEVLELTVVRDGATTTLDATLGSRTA